VRGRVRRADIRVRLDYCLAFGDGAIGVGRWNFGFAIASGKQEKP